jgi:hypothetical protein
MGIFGGWAQSANQDESKVSAAILHASFMPQLQQKTRVPCLPTPAKTPCPPQLPANYPPRRAEPANGDGASLGALSGEGPINTRIDCESAVHAAGRVGVGRLGVRGDGLRICGAISADDTL